MAYRRIIAPIVLAGSLCAAFAPPALAGGPATERDLVAAIRAEVGDDPEIHYSSADVDLNGDGRQEAVVYVLGPRICGTGGCPMLVFSRDKKGGFRLVSYTELTRPPIRVARSRTHGWKDLIVFVAGGGILEGYDMLLPFDGKSYPESPFLPPCRRVKTSQGHLLIRRHSFDEAKPLTLERP